MAEITFHDDSEQRSIELRVDGDVAALISYDRSDGALALTHTESRAGFEGQGYATQLVEHVIGQAAAAGESVLPFCSFVAAWFAKHPERIDLVPASARGSLGLAG